MDNTGKVQDKQHAQYTIQDSHDGYFGDFGGMYVPGVLKEKLELEGIIPAIESSHAVALAMSMMKDKDALSIINLSGRGDKDMGRKMM